MGGSVSVTIREPNGQEHRMLRWTNSMPWAINSVRMLSEKPDPAHLAQYLKNRNEWDEEGHLAPDGYGLVVVDFVTHTLLSHQGYTTFGRRPAVHLGNDISFCKPRRVRLEELRRALEDAEEYTECLQLKEWWDAKRIKEIGRRQNREFFPEPKLLQCSFEEMVLVTTRDDRDYYEFRYDISPFTLLDAASSDTPLRDVLTGLIAAGFKISPKEQELWNGAFQEEAERKAFEASTSEVLTKKRRNRRNRKNKGAVK